MQVWEILTLAETSQFLRFYLLHNQEMHLTGFIPESGSNLNLWVLTPLGVWVGGLALSLGSAKTICLSDIYIRIQNK